MGGSKRPCIAHVAFGAGRGSWNVAKVPKPALNWYGQNRSTSSLHKDSILVQEPFLSPEAEPDHIPQGGAW